MNYSLLEERQHLDIIARIKVYQHHIRCYNLTQHHSAGVHTRAQTCDAAGQEKVCVISD